MFAPRREVASGRRLLAPQFSPVERTAVYPPKDLRNQFIRQTMIQDRNYAEEEVAEDLLDLIREYEAEIKKLKERESALLKSLQASLGDSAAALIKEYVAVRTDWSLRLFELDLRTRYADEEAATSKAVDRIFKEYE